jgi:hypothetical protein
MGFSPIKFKPESGANRIKSADDAYSFMVHMRLSYQNKPHWQVARQAINQACMSEASEIRAWRSPAALRLSSVAIAVALSPAAPIDRSSPSSSGVHGGPGAVISSLSAS